MDKESTPKMDWSAEDLPTAFKAFKSHCEFMFGGPLKKKDEEEKCNYLMLWVGEKGRNIYSTWTLTADSKKLLKTYYEEFEKYCKPKSNLIFSRFKYRQIVQEPGEPFEQFLTRLKVQIKDCGYDETVKDEMIRDSIVFGVNDISVREKLIREGSDLTLQTCIDIARTYELSNMQLKNMSGEDQQVHSLSKHKKTFKPSKNTASKRESAKPKAVSTFDCGKCGTNHGPKECPAYGKICLSCKKLNHFAKKCQLKQNAQPASRNKKKLHELEVDEDDLFVGEISVNENEKAWYSDIAIDNVNISFKLDTGAETNVISLENFEQISTGPMAATNVKLSTYGNTVIKPLGKATLNCQSNSSECNLDFYVVDLKSTPILGLSACKKLNLLQRVNEIQADTTLESLLNNNSDIFNGIGTFEDKYHIELDKSVKPVVDAPRKVPHTLLPKYESALQKLVKDEVIVPVDEATDWVNSIVIVEKKNGDLRLCLDPRNLNKAIKREHYKIPTLEEVTATLSGKKVFTILDEKDGYHQVQLDEESSYLCTFQTPFGRYRYKKLPFGISSASEVFQKRNQETFGDIEGVQIIVDDMIIAGKDEHEHDVVMGKVMERARKKNIKFNKSKVQYKVKEVKYMGSIIGEHGMKPDPEKVNAIVNIQVPVDKSGVQRLLGTVNYLAPFIPNISEITAPLRMLLKKDVPFLWSHEQSKAMEKIKSILTAKPVLKFYDVNKEVVIQADASKNGLGSCLLQDKHPIAFASRSLTDAEKNYAQIEKELLAVVFACERFYTYIYGKVVTVHTDHKPLEAIYKKPLHKAPPRLQRMLLRLQKYDLHFQYTPGKFMYVADTLSRAYIEESTPSSDELAEEADKMIHSLVRDMPFSDDRVKQVHTSVQNDIEMKILKQTIMNGWPNHKRDLPEQIKPYWIFKEQMHIAEDLIFVGEKLVIPADQRSCVLKAIHEGHLGMEKCKTRARKSVYWPCMNSDIAKICSECSICNRHKNNNQHEPLIQHEIPERPWQKVGIDLFEYKTKDYVLVVDYYSKFIETRVLTSKTAQSVAQKLKSIFSIHGIPEEIIADNMPFSSMYFSEFAKNYAIKVSTSSPTHSQSNGMAERSIQTVKSLFKKADEEGKDEYMALLQYRNTPIAGCDYSPAQLLMNRMLRDKIPTNKALLKPKVPESAREQLVRRQLTQKVDYDKNTKAMKPLTEGDSVRYRVGKTWEPAVVKKKHVTPRSYVIQNQAGTTLRRNRYHLRKTAEPCITPTHADLFNENNFKSVSSKEVVPSSANIDAEVSDKNNPPQRVEPNLATTPQDSSIESSRPRRDVRKPARFRDENFSY